MLMDWRCLSRREDRMRRLLAALLGMIVGYPLFAFVGYELVELFSGNQFDGSVEASMTSAFVIGPIGAIIGLVTGAILGKRKPVPADMPKQ
jgi:hypothetical protein